MLKIILLIVFCILAIVSYIVCKKTKNSPISSIIAALFSVILLVAVVFNTHLIIEDKKVENEFSTKETQFQSDESMNELEGKGKRNDTNTNTSSNSSNVSDNGNDLPPNKNESKKNNDLNTEDNASSRKGNDDSQPIGSVSR